MKELYIKKETNTFTDTIECIGLASIIKNIYDKNGMYPEIVIEDKGYYYQLSLEENLDEKLISNCSSFDFFDYIAIKNESVDFTTNFIDYEREKEVKKIYDDFRKRYNKLSKVEQDSEPLKSRTDYDILSIIASPNYIKGYKKAFINIRNWFEFFPEFLNFIFSFYNSHNVDEEIVKKDIKDFITERNISIKKINALQIINPSKGKGANRGKASGIRPEVQDEYWLKQIIRFTGIWNCLTLRPIKTGTKSWDTKIYALMPKDILLSILFKVYSSFKSKVKGSDSIKLDIIIVILATQELIRKNENFLDEWKFFNPKDKIYGFHVVYLKDLGKNKAVTNIGFLGLPEFILIDSKETGLNWIDILDEHEKIIFKIKEDYSSNISMLQKYRHFLSASDFDAFFEFQFEYSANLLADITKDKTDSSKQYLKPFTIKNMEVLLMCKKEFSPILKNEGFRNIAKAIRNATISAQYAKAKKGSKTKYPVHYGIAQDLKRKSDYKEEFLKYISDFISSYNSETARVAENNPNDLKEGKIRATVKIGDIDEFVSLVDEYGSNIVGRLLCVYGYSLEKKEK